MRNAGTICKCCGSKEAVCKGMCWACYLRTRRAADKKPKRDIRGERTKAIIVDFALHDVSQSDLARKYGVSRQRVSKILKEANLSKTLDNKAD